MNVGEMLASLSAQGVRFTVQGDRLHINAPVGIISARDLKFLADHKKEALTMLSVYHTGGDLPLVIPATVQQPQSIRAQALEQLRTDRDAALSEWNALCDRLEELQEKYGQDSVEFVECMSGWEQVDIEYRLLDDSCSELEAELRQEGIRL